ncbi:MAG TPA: helix-turn-helix domain-containing protein [Caulobacteraceae bacterium]|jgi:AraC-like DNA-binding protein|nr:helix-turn-helix domain-containing protein [Caulobacteraceae bacterium]
MATPVRSVDEAYLSTLLGEEKAQRLYRRAGLLAGSRPPKTLDFVTYWRLCAENIQACNDESHGVAAEPVPRGSLSVLFTHAKEADDLMGALERFTSAAHLIRKECRITLGRSGDTVRLTVRPTERGSLKAEIYCEGFLIVTHCALRWMTGRRLDPLSARGARALKAFGPGIIAAAHAPVVHRGEGATFVYRSSDMDAPVLEQKYKAWGEAEFGNFVAMLGEDIPPERPASPDVDAVLAALRRGLRSQTEIAGALRISTPTLRRRLAEAGSSFRELSGSVRQAEVRELLATEMSMQAIAERLGLSDDRSLRRFCAEQLGMSPRQYRRLA